MFEYLINSFKIGVPLSFRFYTQEEIGEIIAYTSPCHIAIMPEYVKAAGKSFVIFPAALIFLFFYLMTCSLSPAFSIMVRKYHSGNAGCSTFGFFSPGTAVLMLPSMKRANK